MIMTSWFGLFLCLSQASFISHVPNTKPDVVIWGQGEKFALVSLKAYLDRLVMTDHEGAADLFTMFVLGIVVLWVTTITVSSFDLSKN